MTEKRLLEHAEYLRGLVRGLLLDPSRVDDVVQETYLRALSKPPAHSRNLRGWLATVARNLAFRLHRDNSRRAQREERVGRPDRLPPTADVAARVEAQKRIAAAVDGLDEPYRTAIVFRYLDGLTPAEIAKRWNVPVKTVKTRLHRGLERLRVRLDRDYGERAQWSLMLLPLALPREGVAVAAGVTVLTMKKIVAALFVLGVFVLFTVNRAGDGESEKEAVARAAGAAESSGTDQLTAPPAGSTTDATAHIASTGALRFVFSGRVVNPEGVGVPGAKVRLVYWGSVKADPNPHGGDKRLRREREPFEDPRVVSDGDGYFRFERPYASRSYLHVDAASFGSLIAGPFEPAEDLDIVLEPTMRFHANVVDPDGNPVVDALVRIVTKSPGYVSTSRAILAKGRTDTDGGIDLPKIVAESVILEVAPRESDLGFADTAVAGKSNVTVTVPRIKTRSVKIIDAQTGEPLTDAYAIVAWSGYQSRSSDQQLDRRRIDADERGVIRFPLQPNYYGHIVSAPGYEVTGLDGETVPLQRSMVVDGVVLDTIGNPVEGVAILIASPQGPGARCFAGLPLVAAWSDADGRFEAEIKLLWPSPGLPDPGVRSIMAVDPRHGCAIVDSIAVKPGTRIGATLRFPKPATLTIEIVGADGAPRAKEWISLTRHIPASKTWTTKAPGWYGSNPAWLIGQRPVTDEDGRAVLHSLPPGDYHIDMKRDRRNLSIEAGQHAVLRIVRGGGPSISGRLLDKNGDPAAKVMIHLNGPTGGVEHTDEEGRFLFEDVKDGEHRIGFHSRRANAWIGRTAEPGDNDVVLREPKDLGSLRISVEGPPHGLAEYSYTTSAGSNYPHGSGFRGISGGITDTPTFAPSKGILVVRSKGYAWTVVPFEAFAGKPTEVHVSLSKAGSVSGTVSAELLGQHRQLYCYLRRADGFPQSLVKGDKNLKHGLERCLGDTRFSTKVESERFEILDVAPGRYLAKLHSYTDGTWRIITAAQEIEVSSGSAITISFVR